MLNIRKLTEKDWDTLVSWWDSWPEWQTPSKDFLPDNGKGGLIIEKDGTPIVAGFIYLTNSKAALLEWIISNPNYKEDDRDLAIELLITGAENLVKTLDYKFIFSITQHKKLMEMHKKLGWVVDEKPSHELTKIL
tara:strand:- start:11469 stop:11873 length:405 start_codon:yes stop_codon:yes gene_type:complete